MDDILQILAGGADITIIGIGLLLLRIERRITRLELRVFGFNRGS